MSISFQFAERAGFTERECDILNLLVNQVTLTSDIAKQLNISEHTVGNHLKNMLRKAKAHNKADLLSLCISEALTRLHMSSLRNGAHSPALIVVDDDEHFQSNLKEALHAIDFNVDHKSFCSANAFTRYLSQQESETLVSKHSIVLLDVHMPDGGGIEVLKRLRQDPRFNTLPVVLLSAHHDKATENQALSLGARTMLQKPDSFAKLVDMMRVLFEYWFKLVPAIPAKESAPPLH